MTGDPTACHSCGVILNRFSKLRDLTPRRVANKRKAATYQELVQAPPLVEKYMYMLDDKEEDVKSQEPASYWQFCQAHNRVELATEELPTGNLRAGGCGPCRRIQHSLLH